MLPSFRTRKIEATLLSLADLKSKYGEYLKLDDVKGGLFLPTEGFIDPRGVAKALADECHALGGKIIENCGVEGVHIKDDVVSSVSTWTGVRIQCKYFVNAAGVWSKRIPVFEKGERLVPRC